MDTSYTIELNFTFLILPPGIMQTVLMQNNNCMVLMGHQMHGMMIAVGGGELWTLLNLKKTLFFLKKKDSCRKY